MMRALPLVIAFAVVIISGVAHGLKTERWIPSADLHRAANRLAEVPLQVGDWEVHEDEMPDAERDLAELESYRKAHYVHRTTGDAVQVLIMCGKPGPIAVHTPYICFVGAGLRLVSDQKTTVEPKGGPATEMTVGLFVRERAGQPEYQRVMWTFSANGDWRVPVNPRAAYSDERFLYKIYVSRLLRDPKEPLGKDPSVDLLRLLMPQLQKHLFPPSPQE